MGNLLNKGLMMNEWQHNEVIGALLAKKNNLNYATIILSATENHDIISK
jgi:hypothetical protein